MKKLLLSIVAIIGIAFFTSCEQNIPPGEDPPCEKTACEKEPPEEPPTDPPKELKECSWRTTNQYFSIVVDDYSRKYMEEELINMIERESSVDVTEAEASRLTFRENGTGYGSGISPRIKERNNFNFKWQLSDDRLKITGTGNSVILIGYESAWEWVDCKIEEYTDDKMVLVWGGEVNLSGIDFSYGEIHTYRYTFEKVK